MRCITVLNIYVCIYAILCSPLRDKRLVLALVASDAVQQLSLNQLAHPHASPCPRTPDPCPPTTFTLLRSSFSFIWDAGSLLSVNTVVEDEEQQVVSILLPAARRVSVSMCTFVRTATKLFIYLRKPPSVRTCSTTSLGLTAAHPYHILRELFPITYFVSCLIVCYVLYDSLSCIIKYRMKL